MNSAAPPRLMASAAVLLVKDVVASANYYRDSMGFTFPKLWGDPPSFVILRRDGIYLMLKQADNPADILCYWTVSKGLWNVYFWISDADALHAEFVSNGAKIDYPVCDQPYGCREFGVQDLDGYDIGFGQDMTAG
jgi:predicted enzyme related to lactoylglutathione lyase